MTRKVYDIKSGHYVIVNEADETSGFNANAQDGENDQEQKQEAQDEETNKPVEQNPDIQKVENDLNAENKRYETLKQSLQQTYERNKQVARDNLTSVKNAASTQDELTPYDRVQTNRDVISAQKKILDLDLKFAEDKNRIELEHARKINAIENNRLQILQKINNEAFGILPGKYSALNESNIHQAKIYMNAVVGDDADSPVQGMVDFKKMFQETELVYGKDKDGYYVICIDRDDFNRIYGAMAAAGFDKDTILSILMPQILDRSQMVK